MPPLICLGERDGGGLGLALLLYPETRIWVMTMSSMIRRYTLQCKDALIFQIKKPHGTFQVLTHSRKKTVFVQIFSYSHIVFQKSEWKHVESSTRRIHPWYIYLHLPQQPTIHECRSKIPSSHGWWPLNLMFPNAYQA